MLEQSLSGPDTNWKFCKFHESVYHLFPDSCEGYLGTDRRTKRCDPMVDSSNVVVFAASPCQ